MNFAWASIKPELRTGSSTITKITLVSTVQAERKWSGNDRHRASRSVGRSRRCSAGQQFQCRPMSGVLIVTVGVTWWVLAISSVIAGAAFFEPWSYGELTSCCLFCLAKLAQINDASSSLAYQKLDRLQGTLPMSIL